MKISNRLTTRNKEEVDTEEEVVVAATEVVEAATMKVDIEVEEVETTEVAGVATIKETKEILFTKRKVTNNNRMKEFKMKLTE